ncbi:MAG TPA: YdeI/OmpD-associated family protein [Thermomicrobiales bacterium]|jgi:uncharacterized protein YdeI (YjbR/CyaY-like superfamily)|nr:YdeI/OmpD-associated family protein [Thermomicrobiales bacterium]
MPSILDTYPHLEFPSRAAFRDWLAANHATSPGIWLVYRKTTAGPGGLTYVEAVEEALCFGWIDGRAGKVDDERARNVFSPRKANSNWSAVNKARILCLQAEGLMTPIGQAKIDAAIADGSWARSDTVESLTEPDDLRIALDADPIAGAGWQLLAPSIRKQHLALLVTSKRPETRVTRITRIIAAARQRAER